jgi:hypothetical protein
MTGAGTFTTVTLSDEATSSEGFRRLLTVDPASRPDAAQLTTLPVSTPGKKCDDPTGHCSSCRRVTFLAGKVPAGEE